MRLFTLSSLILVSLVSCCLLLTGCSKEEPNPEERDPIFKDLEKRAADYQKAYDEASAKHKEFLDNLEKSEPNTIDRRDLERDLAKSQKAMLESEQWAHYYKIRSDRRKVVDHLTYKEAFHAKAEWPNPHEYSDYLVNRRLVEAPLNWSARVPKITDRIPSSTKGPEKPKEAAKKEE